MEEKNMEKIYTLRDTVHLDIKFNEHFFALIGTREFQRLSRIKQLSSEYMLFPTATHTRFSHSIGTYYVMQKLIDRLETVLNHRGIGVDQEQKDLALASALLHDIGHGPFSHTFENISAAYSHEEWTIKILESPETEIHRALVNNFGEGFLPKLISVFHKEKAEKDTILALIHQLISSQMDADRMDYLLRDSYFTGVNNGGYDLNRLVASIEIEEVGENLQICVNEKFISSLEEYIMARFYMHKEVYQHPLKRQLENIVQKVFRRARELEAAGQLENLDGLIKKVLMDKLSLEDYLDLDDNILIYQMSVWRKSKDEILSSLCRAFVDRKKFQRYRASTDKSLETFLNEELEKKGIQGVDWSKEYSYIKDQVKIPVYNKGEDNIWVKLRTGQVVDITEASYILGNIDYKNKFERVTEYYHKQMIENKFGEINL